MKKKPIIIVIGNEKGGSGKTTTAMHLIVSLLYLDFKVASIDLDIRQKSLSTYIENRVKALKQQSLEIPAPQHFQLDNSTNVTINEINNNLQTQFLNTLNLASEFDFIIIDSPGHNHFLAQLAHSFADIIITPFNDSFVDLDVIAHFNNDNYEILSPGIYSQMVWEQKINRAKRDRGTIDWILMRNRISSTNSSNKRNIFSVLEQLKKRLGCRVAPGFGDRVIFKELFLQGLTIFDIKHQKIKIPMTLSHIAARQELLNLLSTLNIEAVNEAIKNRIL
jgi:chromosome partitioning protein